MTSPMAELERYMTPEFTEVFLAAINADAAFQKASRKMDEVISLRGLDTSGREGRRHPVPDPRGLAVPRGVPGGGRAERDPQ